MRVNAIALVAFSWGLCSFLPVGVMYLHLVLLLIAVGVSADVAPRISKLRESGFVLPVALLLAWTFLAAAVGDFYPDLPTRLFHTVRVAVLWCLGMMLWRSEARSALAGFLIAAVFAATIVAAHHIWGLPEWAIWKSLIVPSNNFSSGNMISMAIAAGAYFCLMLRQDAKSDERWLAAAAALALALTVVFHAVSRNAQLLLALALVIGVLYRFRSLYAGVAGLVVALALSAMAWHFSPKIQSRFAEVTSNLQAATASAQYNSSIGIRWRMYQEAASQTVEHPVFGTGVGSWLPHWKSVWRTLQQDLPPEEHRRFAEVNNPHNDFLLAAMETGVLGMLLLVWPLALFVRRGWQQASAAGGITVVVTLAIVATAMVNAPLRDAALGMTLLWLMGVSVASHEDARHV